MGLEGVTVQLELEVRYSWGQQSEAHIHSTLKMIVLTRKPLGDQHTYQTVTSPKIKKRRLRVFSFYFCEGFFFLFLWKSFVLVVALVLTAKPNPTNAGCHLTPTNTSFSLFKVFFFHWKPCSALLHTNFYLWTEHVLQLIFLFFIFMSGNLHLKSTINTPSISKHALLHFLKEYCISKSINYC